MEKLFKNSVFKTIFGMTLLIFLLNGISISQEKKASTKKIFKEIAGKYEFSWEGPTSIITFWVEDGKLKAAPEGEEPAALEPVEGEELKFQASIPDGSVLDLEFIRDEKGKITKCKISGMGMEMEGQKIKDNKKLPA
jgi:hypothetical protein